MDISGPCPMKALHTQEVMDIHIQLVGEEEHVRQLRVTSMLPAAPWPLASRQCQTPR